jgi:hypothetical protein
VAWIVGLVSIGAGGVEHSTDVLRIARPGDLTDLASLGLTLAEGKRLLAGIQQEIGAAQARVHAARRPECRSCGTACRMKDSRQHQIATLFGQVTVRLPRFRCAGCGTTAAGVEWPPRARSTPELDRLRAQFSALLTYRTAAALLGQMFPVDAGAAHETLRRHTFKVAGELPMPATVKPTTPATAVVVTLDAIFVRSGEDGERHLEVRIGNVETATGRRQVFGAVAKTDTDLATLIRSRLDAVGRTGKTALATFTDGCPGLRRILLDASITRLPTLDWFHLAIEHLRWRLWNGKAQDAGISLDRIRAVMHPGRTADRHGADRGHGQLPAEPPDEQVTADALDPARRRPPAPGPPRRLQRQARHRLRARRLVVGGNLLGDAPRHPPTRTSFSER